MISWISAKTAPYIATALMFLAMIGACNWALGERDKRVVAQQQLSQLQKSLQDAQAKAESQKKELEDAMQQRVESSRTQVRIEAAENERRLRAAVAAQRADADSLREQLRSAHRRAGEASGDPAAACDERAAATGDVLAEALRVQAELAAAAERHAAEVRSLLDAWPRTTSTEGPEMTAPKTIPKNPVADDTKAYEEAHQELDGDVKVAGLTVPVRIPTASPSTGKQPTRDELAKRRGMSRDQFEDEVAEGNAWLHRGVPGTDTRKEQDAAYKARQELNKLKSSGGPR